MKALSIVAAAIAVFFCFPEDGTFAQESAAAPQTSNQDSGVFKESQEERDARMKWWREDRFGMFIHWGLYAIPAGEWKGKRYQIIGEWLMKAADIPREEYEPLAKQFNPQKYDPVEWVRIAKAAGMKYMVITSKHHDGFCLFDTAETDWDVVDASPYGRDLIKPLADECKKQGIKFCLYFSIMDWHHPTQCKSEKGYNPTDMKEGRKEEYVTSMTRQVEQLLKTCDPEVFWFDGEWPTWWTEEDGQKLYAHLRKLKPSLIINNRIGKGRKGMQGFNKDDREYSGDFGTPEQEIPETGVPGVDWESCMTMNKTWGFKKHDHNWKSNEVLIRNLIDIASKGGNFLLNVGPKSDGEFPSESVERLAAMGKWMDVNSESIYGTTASPVEAPEWGRYTTKKTDASTTLYAHVFEWPESGTITVPWNQASDPKCTLLAGGQALAAKRDGNRVTITLPATAPDAIATVVRISADK